MQEKFLGLMAQFNDETQHIFTGHYDILCQNGFIGNQIKNIPYHITLGNHAISYGDKQLCDDLERICSETSCININLSYIGLFDLKVLFVAPNMNFELLKLQNSFFNNCGNGYHSWAAHVTLLMDEPVNILKALPIAVEHFEPFKAQIESVALYEFYPARLIREYRLNCHE